MVSSHDSIEQVACPQANHTQPQFLAHFTHTCSKWFIYCSKSARLTIALKVQLWRQLPRLILQLQLSCHLHFHKMHLKMSPQQML